MKESPTGCWTNHHSIVEYGGQWYLFYHHNDYSPSFDKNRSVCCDSLFFNADGTIREVIPTRRGVGITKATSKIHIDRYTSIQGAAIDYIDINTPFDGWKTIFAKQGDSVTYNSVDFGKGVKKITFGIIKSNGAKLSVYADGKKIAAIDMAPAEVRSEQTVKMTADISGIHHISVELESGDAEIDWISFK